MKNISTYISELLYQHDCVIVPGFGGFVARHVAAAIQNSGNVISPPSKTVLFNKNLQNNDGLLANYIMEKHFLSYTEANHRINEFSRYCSGNLYHNKRLELENIGVLYLDQEKNVQFEPELNVNYLISSFGLSPLFAQTLFSVEAPKSFTEPVFKDRLAPVSEKIEKKKNYKRIAALLIGSQVVIASLLLSFWSKPLNNTAWANLNPFGVAEKGKYAPKTYKENKAFVPYMQDELQADANGLAQLKVNEKVEHTLMVRLEEVNLTTKPERRAEPLIVASEPYQLVLGCFAMQENALKHIKKLQSKNIPAGINGKNNKGLFVVSGGTFANKDEAREALLRLRETYPHAWLMAGK